MLGRHSFSPFEVAVEERLRNLEVLTAQRWENTHSIVNYLETLNIQVKSLIEENQILAKLLEKTIEGTNIENKDELINELCDTFHSLALEG